MEQIKNEKEKNILGRDKLAAKEGTTEIEGTWKSAMRGEEGLNAVQSSWVWREVIGSRFGGVGGAGEVI